MFASFSVMSERLPDTFMRLSTSGVLQLFALRPHDLDQFLHLTVRGCRIHAGEFQALTASDASVADDGGAGFEEAPTDGGVDPVWVKPGLSRDVTK